MKACLWNVYLLSFGTYQEQSRRVTWVSGFRGIFCISIMAEIIYTPMTFPYYSSAYGHIFYKNTCVLCVCVFLYMWLHLCVKVHACVWESEVEASFSGLLYPRYSGTHWCLISQLNTSSHIKEAQLSTLLWGIWLHLPSVDIQVTLTLLGNDMDPGDLNFSPHACLACFTH